MKILAVSGGSGCGKTFFTKLLGKRLPKSAVLPLDSYYKDRPDKIPSEEYDFDIPQAFDFDLYHEHLEHLISGKSIQMPHFGYNSGKRKETFSVIEPEDYLIIEGLHVLLHSKVREILSYSFYMESPLDVAICRMCLRDIKNYDVTAEYRLNQYLRFVRPAYFKHILPTKQYADIVIINNYDSHLNKYVDDYILNK